MNDNFVDVDESIMKIKEFKEFLKSKNVDIGEVPINIETDKIKFPQNEKLDSFNIKSYAYIEFRLREKGETIFLDVSNFDSYLDSNDLYVIVTIVVHKEDEKSAQEALEPKEKEEIKFNPNECVCVYDLQMTMEELGEYVLDKDNNLKELVLPINELLMDNGIVSFNEIEISSPKSIVPNVATAISTEPIPYITVFVNKKDEEAALKIINSSMEYEEVDELADDEPDEEE